SPFPPMTIFLHSSFTFAMSDYFEGFRIWHPRPTRKEIGYLLNSRVRLLRTLFSNILSITLRSPLAIGSQNHGPNWILFYKLKTRSHPVRPNPTSILYEYDSRCSKENTILHVASGTPYRTQKKMMAY